MYKSIVYKSKSSEWFGTDYNMNIYRGCSHGCIYCDSRSNCYKVKNFDKVSAKENALVIIRDDLRRKVKKGVIGTGAMSDPYNPLEKELLLTRHSLELISAFGFGINISTKSNLILRDIDILQEIKENSSVIIGITITAFDDVLTKKLEPNVSSSSERFETLKILSENNIYCGVLLMPVLPFINDTTENILNIVRRSKEVGARFIYPFFGVTLRDEQREYFYKKLDKMELGLKERYIKRFKNNYQCQSDRSSELWRIFKNECDKYGILYNMRDIIKSYKLGYEVEQITLW